MDKYFIKLPNDLFYSEEKKSLLQETQDFKTLLVLDYLYTNTNRKGITLFSLEDIVIESGYTPDRHKGKSNEQFKNILIKLQELKIIVTEIDLSSIKPNQFVKCKLNMFNKNADGEDVKFVIITDKEKEKILHYDKEKIDNLKMLFYYCYLKSRMYKRNTNIQVFGGRAEVCFPSFKRIHEDLAITDNVIEKYNNILQDINLIRIGNAGLYYFKGCKNSLKETCNIYTLCTGYDETDKLNLEEGIKYYKKLLISRFGEEIVFTKNRKYKNNNKKDNGYIARISYLEKNGKATPEQIKKKNKLIEKREKNIYNKKFEMKMLLERNEGKTLTEIYFDDDKDELSERAYDFEMSLGLRKDDENENSILTVDYDYYVWVINNYERKKHDYFVNCIKKHIKENSLDKVM